MAKGQLVDSVNFRVVNGSWGIVWCKREMPDKQEGWRQGWQWGWQKGSPSTVGLKTKGISSQA